MNSNLPEKYKNKFFNRIKYFFVKLFNGKVVKSKDETKKIEIERNKSNRIQSSTNIQQMKNLSRKTMLKEDIVDMIEKNPRLIYNLSTENLRNLKVIYSEIFEENSRLISKLKKKVETKN